MRPNFRISIHDSLNRHFSIFVRPRTFVGPKAILIHPLLLPEMQGFGSKPLVCRDARFRLPEMKVWGLGSRVSGLGSPRCKVWGICWPLVCSFQRWYTSSSTIRRSKPATTRFPTSIARLNPPCSPIPEPGLWFGICGLGLRVCGSGLVVGSLGLGVESLGL